VFSQAFATGGDWQAICEGLVAQLGTLPSGAGLGFLYASDSLADQLGALVSGLRIKTGVPHWVGSLGSGICATGLESYDTPAAAVMVTDLDPERFRLVPSARRDFSDFLARTAAWRMRHLASVAVVHGDPSNGRTPAMIEALADGLDGGYLVGGLTSSAGPLLQVTDEPVSGGVSGVLLAGDVPFVTGLTQGCSLLGRRHTVGTCQRNVIATLDDRPALDVLRETLGGVTDAELAHLGGQVFAALPVAGSDRPDYLVRNLVGIDPDQGLVAIGDLVEQGQPIQFARRDRDSAKADLVRMVRDLKHRLPGPAKGALYHTCLGRGRHLFGDDSAELRLVEQELGPVPLVGFYANGEISHRRLYGYTGVLSVFC
jgi:small ligand-binding sensory domain FIST